MKFDQFKVVLKTSDTTKTLLLWAARFEWEDGVARADTKCLDTGCLQN